MDDRFLEVQMGRSGSGTLHVVGGLDMRKRSSEAWIRAHSGRIETLELRLENGTAKILADLMTRTHFPMLRSLVLEGRLDHWKVKTPVAAPLFGTGSDGPSKLLTVHFRDLYVSPPALRQHGNVNSFTLDGHLTHGFKIKLDDLLSSLPYMSSLARLKLGGKIIVSSTGVPRPAAALSSLRSFTLFGRPCDFQAIDTAFEMSSVDQWDLSLEADERPETGEQRIREMMGRYADSPTKVCLRRRNARRCDIALVTEDDDLEPKFRVTIAVAGGAPCETFARFITEAQVLPSVRCIELRGGPDGLDAWEPDDDVIERVVEALPNVESVILRGNGNSWGRMPIVLVRRMRAGGVGWNGVRRVDWLAGCTLGYVLKDWLSWFEERRRAGSQLIQLNLVEARVSTGAKEECTSLMAAMRKEVGSVEGRLYWMPRELSLLTAQVRELEAL